MILGGMSATDFQKWALKILLLYVHVNGCSLVRRTLHQNSGFHSTWGLSNTSQIFKRYSTWASLKMAAVLPHRALLVLASRLDPVDPAHLLACLLHSRRALPDSPPVLNISVRSLHSVH